MLQFGLVLGIVVQVIIIAILSGMEIDRDTPESIAPVIRMLIIMVTMTGLIFVSALVMI